MATNKVVYNGTTLIDITDSTVTPEDLAEGETAYDKSGAKITGTLDISNYSVSDSSSTSETGGGINKVIYCGKTLIDISDSTVDSSKLKSGVIAYDKSGNRIVGTLVQNSSPSVVKKTFSEATDAEIVEMVTAAQAGTIDLATDCGWDVGQEHIITLPAIASSGTYDGTSWTVGESHTSEQITLVLVDTGENSGYTFADGSTVHFLIGFKNRTTTGGYINSTGDNAGSWDSSARRVWCNTGLREAMESVLPGIFKLFNVITATDSGRSVKTSQDYFSFFAEMEVVGSGNYSFSAESSALKLLKYFETSANRIKYRNTGMSGSYWLRSIRNAGTAGFCRINTSGNSTYDSANSTNGLSAFGCV